MAHLLITLRIEHEDKDDEFAKAIGIDLRDIHQPVSNDQEELNGEVLYTVAYISDEEENRANADPWSRLHRVA